MDEELIAQLKAAASQGATEEQLVELIRVYNQKGGTGQQPMTTPEQGQQQESLSAQQGQPQQEGTSSFADTFAMYAIPQLGGMPSRPVYKPKKEMNVIESGLAKGQATVESTPDAVRNVFQTLSLKKLNSKLEEIKDIPDTSVIEGVPVGQLKQQLRQDFNTKAEVATQSYLRAAERMKLGEAGNAPNMVSEIEDFEGFAQFVGKAFFEALPQMGATISTLGLGSFAIEAGAIQMEIIQNVIDDPSNNLKTAREVIAKAYIDPEWAIGAGLVAGAVDLVSLATLAKFTGLNKVATGFLRTGATRLASSEAKKQLGKSLGSRVATQSIKSMATESITEGIQGEVESFGAAQGAHTEYTFEEDRLLTGMLAGAAAGGGIGVFGTALTHSSAQAEAKQVYSEKVAEDLDMLVKQAGIENFTFKAGDPHVRAVVDLGMNLSDVVAEIEKMTSETDAQEGVPNLSKMDMDPSAIADDVITKINAEYKQAEVDQALQETTEEETPTIDKIKVYRGKGNNIGDGINEGFKWVAEDESVARNYASVNDDKTFEVEVSEINKPKNSFDFGFKLGNTEVRGNDMTDRLRSIVAQKLKNNDITQDEVTGILENIEKYGEQAGDKLEPYHTKINKKGASKILSNILSALGYDSVVIKETNRDGVLTNTYGIINKSTVESETKQKSTVESETKQTTTKKAPKPLYKKKNMLLMSGKQRLKEKKRRSLFGEVERVMGFDTSSKKNVAKAIKALEYIAEERSKEFPEITKAAKEQIELLKKQDIELSKIGEQKKLEDQAERAAKKAAKGPAKVDRVWEAIKENITNLKQFEAVVEQINKKLKNRGQEVLTDKEVRTLRSRANSKLEIRNTKDIPVKVRAKIKELLRKKNDPTATVNDISLIEYIARVDDALNKFKSKEELDALSEDPANSPLVGKEKDKVGDAMHEFVNIQIKALADGKYEELNSDEFDFLRYSLIDYLPKEHQMIILEDIKSLEEGAKIKRKLFNERQKAEAEALRRRLLPLLLNGETTVPAKHSAKMRELKDRFKYKRLSVKQYTLYLDTFGNIMDYLGTDDINKGVRETLFNKEFSMMERKARVAEIAGQNKWNDKIYDKFLDVFTGEISEKNTKKARIKAAGAVHDNIRKQVHNLINFEYTDGQQESLDGSLDEVLNYWMQLQNEDVKKALEQEGKGEDFERAINEIMAENPKLKEFGTFLLEDFYPSYFVTLDKAYRERTGLPLIRTEKYAPLVREVDTTDKGSGIGDAFREWFPAISALNAYLKPRVGGSSKNKIQQVGAIAMAGKYIVANEHFKAYDPLVRKMNAVFGDTEFRQAIKIRFGDHSKGQRSHILDILDLKREHLSHGRIMHLFADNAMDKIRTNIVMANIGAIPNLAIKQLTSFPGYASEMPKMPKGVGKSYVGYLLEFLSNPMRKGRKLLEDNPFLVERLKRNSRSVDEVILGLNSTKYLFGRQVGRKGLSHYTMSFIRLGDIAAIMFGGYPVYKAHYDIGISQGMTTEQAKEYANLRYMDTTLNTQQSGEVADMPAIKHNAVGRLITSFASTPIQYWSNIRAGMRAMSRSKVNSREYRQGAYRVAMYGFILPALFQWAAQAFKPWPNEDEDEENTLKYRLAYSSVDNFMSGSGYVGFMLDAVTRKLVLGEDFGYGGTTILDSFMEDIGKSIELSYVLLSGNPEEKEHLEEDLAVNIIASLSSFVGIPIGNAVKLVTETYDDVRDNDGNNVGLKALGYSDWALNVSNTPKKKSGYRPSNLKGRMPATRKAPVTRRAPSRRRQN